MKKCINNNKCDIPFISEIKNDNFIEITIKAMNEYIFDEEKRTKKIKNKLHWFIQLSLTFSIYEDITKNTINKKLEKDSYTITLVEYFNKGFSFDSLNYFKNISLNFSQNSFEKMYNYYHI